MVMKAVGKTDAGKGQGRGSRNKNEAAILSRVGREV